MARNPSAGAWLNAAGRQPMLALAEEVHLGALVRAWQDHPDGSAEASPSVIRRGLRARNRMVSANLRLVSMVAERMRRPPHVALEDALQAGAIGLCRAAEMFDPARGYKFSTYAYLWIRQSITNEVDKSGTIRVPSNVCAAMRGQKYGDPSREQLEAAALVWHGCLSLSTPATGTDGDDCTLDSRLEGGRLEVATLGQAEEVSAAWEAMQEADPTGTALLQLHHADGAGVRELGQLEGIGGPAMRRRLEVVSDRLRALPAVQLALAG